MTLSGVQHQILRCAQDAQRVFPYQGESFREKQRGNKSMSKMSLVVLHIEGDAAAISAACEVVRKELARMTGSAQTDAQPLPPLAPSTHLADSKGGAQRAPRQAGTPVPLSSEKGSKPAAGNTVAGRILRYLAESHESGEPDCTVDEVFRLSGAGTRDSAQACLRQLKSKRLAKLGAQRGS
jgi:hypothetical protein